MFSLPMVPLRHERRESFSDRACRIRLCFIWDYRCWLVFPDHVSKFSSPPSYPIHVPLQDLKHGLVGGFFPAESFLWSRLHPVSVCHFIHFRAGGLCWSL